MRFFKDVMQRLNDIGSSVVIMPSFNAVMWGANTTNSGLWQPLEWLDATLGAVQYPSINYLINTMTVGNWFEQVVDGQSSVVMKSNNVVNSSYIGVDPTTDGRTGNFLAIADWSMKDPGPSMPLSKRRLRLHARAVELSPHSGSSFENKYVETIVKEDLH